ncbi:MAG: DUF4234 domain-containing protein [Clostridia bacterium]|nr:DUF4234 domain-containing protein [Clostridia bacterium]MBQ7296639.1 DUF4234 domain-containing protein [Clostridia bacterium]
MNDLKLSFSKISPRLMGYMAGVIWLWATINDTFDSIFSIFENRFTDEFNIDYTELIFIATGFIVSLIIGIGLIKNHPKIIIAGIVLSIADSVIYMLQFFPDDYINILINIPPLVSLLLILCSIIFFKKGLAVFSVLATAILNIIVPFYQFVISITTMPYDNLFDSLFDIATDFISLGFGTATVSISLALFIYILISYEGEDGYDSFTEEARLSAAYISITTHILLSLFTMGIWNIIWTYRTTKSINKISNDGKEYNPIAVLLLHAIPFYSLYWTYTQTNRLENELIKHGEEKGNMGALSVIIRIIDGFAGTVYMQYKINEYCIISKKKLKKKRKYDDDYDENYGIIPEYPVDTTVEKETEIILEEHPWED